MRIFVLFTACSDEDVQYEDWGQVDVVLRRVLVVEVTSFFPSLTIEVNGTPHHQTEGSRAVIQIPYEIPENKVEFLIHVTSQAGQKDKRFTIHFGKEPASGKRYRGSAGRSGSKRGKGKPYLHHHQPVT